MTKTVKYNSMANSRDKDNTKNWLHRLRQLKIRRRTISTDNVNEETVYQRNLNSNFNNDFTRNSGGCTKTRNGFRRSIIKMHTRVKNVFKHRDRDNNTPRNSSSVSISTTSDLLNRVTLNSPTHPIENNYSIEPIKANSSLIASNSCNGESISRLPIQTNSDSEDNASAPRIPPKRKDPANSSRAPKYEIANLSNYYWYWGPISRAQAEERLKDSPDGAFLVRDSTSDRYIFTMSFRNVGKILHTRIDLTSSGYSLFDQIGYKSVAKLVEDAVTKSKHSVYCYTKTKCDISPNFPVRLTLPVSRYDKVPSLKHLSRFVIRQFVNKNDMDKLPLPVSLIGYLQEEGQYF